MKKPPESVAQFSSAKRIAVAITTPSSAPGTGDVRVAAHALDGSPRSGSREDLVSVLAPAASGTSALAAVSLREYGRRRCACRGGIVRPIRGFLHGSLRNPSAARRNSIVGVYDDRGAVIG